jgi:hypothetical protein
MIVRFGPDSARHRRTRRSKVRRCESKNFPGCSRRNQSNSVFASSRGSARSRSSTAAHTAANGSVRVRYVRGIERRLGNAG